MGETRRTALLLGAGASKDAGLPLSDELTRHVAAALADDRKAKDLALLLNQIIAAIIAHNGELGISAFAPLNIERVVSSIRLLADRRKHEAAPFVRSWTPSLDAVDHGTVSDKTAEAVLREVSAAIAQRHPRGQRLRAPLSDAIHEASVPGAGDVYRRLEEVVVELVADRLRAIDVSYFQPLAKLLEEQDTLDIATLNYDLTIETYAEQFDVGLSRGIERRLDNGSLCWAPRGINLYKIHGSVDWELTDRGKYLSGNSSDMVELAWETVSVVQAARQHPPIRPAIVLGDREKLEALAVTLELLYDFTLALRRADRLIVVGYSFGDKHINRMIADWMDGDSARKLSILDPSWDGVRHQLGASTFLQRIAGAIANHDRTGLRGHVVKLGTREGLSRIIDEWPDDPAARAIDVSLDYDGARPFVTLKVETDCRVQYVSFRAGLPDAFDNDAVMGDQMLDVERVTPQPTVGMPDLPSIQIRFDVYEAQAQELTSILAHGESAVFEITGLRDTRTPQRPFDFKTFDIEVGISYVAGRGKRIWAVRDGQLSERAAGSC